jgi:hypothetical protein
VSLLAHPREVRLRVAHAAPAHTTCSQQPPYGGVYDESSYEVRRVSCLSQPALGDERDPHAMSDLFMGHAVSYGHAKECDGEHMHGAAYMASKGLELLASVMGTGVTDIVAPFVETHLSKADLDNMDDGGATRGDESKLPSHGLGARWRMLDGALNLLGHVMGYMQKKAKKKRVERRLWTTMAAFLNGDIAGVNLDNPELPVDPADDGVVGPGVAAGGAGGAGGAAVGTAATPAVSLFRGARARSANSC